MYADDNDDDDDDFSCVDNLYTDKFAILMKWGGKVASNSYYHSFTLNKLEIELLRSHINSSLMNTFSDYSTAEKDC